MRWNRWRRTFRRWLRFNLVGAIGIGVQLCVLATLKAGLHLDYLHATALAVEAAVIHNFVWHERYTWADRPGGKTLLRLARFNLTTGLLSILGNLLAMRILVGVVGLPYLPANGITITACSLMNFVVSDRLVFAGAKHFI